MNKDSVMIRENVIYKIVRDITLSDGETFEIPGDCTLDFQGGKIIGGRVVFKNTKVLPFGCVITDYVKSQISGTFVKGQCFFDVELKKPIWWNGESWVEEQDKLVSGTNIKTINGESILGSGDIVIEGGGSSSGGRGAYAEVSHGTGETTFTLTPNTFHVWDEVASLDLSFADETAGVANEYLFQFTSGATATMLTLPDGLKWANDSTPKIAENMIYQVSVLKGLASVLEFGNDVALIENKATLTDAANGEVSFQYPVASTITVSVRGDMTYKLTFNEGEQVKSANELSIEGYTIVDIAPANDNTYIYVF